MRIIIEISLLAGVVILAVVMGIVFTGLARVLALRFNILDRPDQRKMHAEPVPYLGGAGIWAAFLLFTISGKFLFPVVFKQYTLPEWFGPGMAAGTLLVAVGVWDDIRGLSAWVKFPVQVLAAAIVVFFTELNISQIANPFGGWIYFGPLTLPITILWIVLLINAINLIDGLDGLAAGVVAISCAFLFIHDILWGQPRLLVLGLAGVCLGFLRYNFAPARIFMGDAGSMFLGLMLSIFSLQVRVKGTTVVTLVVPLLVLGIPILDTALAFLRRLSQGKHPFQGDARHIHHRFLALGLSVRQVVVVIYFFCIALGIFALVMIRLTPPYRLTVVGLLVLLVLFMIMALSHLENQYLEILEQVRAYRDWARFQERRNGGPERVCAPGPGTASHSGPAGNERREYSPPAISPSLMDRLLRAEEQRTEDVLIVGSPSGQARLREVVAHLGHRVLCAPGLAEAEKIFAENQPGVIVIEDAEDIGKVASFVVSVHLRSPKTSILILTPASDDADRLEMLRLGVSNLLPACASDEVLELMIANTLESRYLKRRLNFLNLLFWLFIFTIPVWMVVGRFIVLIRSH
jgi:UDP-GlcNAc:undecaprenyl-phosphate GlcNAc-1-phosphate transferase